MEAFLKSGKLGQARPATDKNLSQGEKVPQFGKKNVWENFKMFFKFYFPVWYAA